MIITINHAKQSKMCSRGARMFAKRHGINWSDFLKNGIDEKELLKLNDAMATRVVKEANNE